MAIQILETFFKNLWFYHIEFSNQYAIYAAKIHSMFQKDNRYIFVFVDTTKISRPPSVGRERLSDLPWVSLQTRLIPKDSDHYSRYQLFPQELKFNAREVDGKLRIQNRFTEKSVYLTEDRTIQVELLHNLLNTSKYQFNNNTMISTAVDLFQSVFIRV
jgi:hypothetical protein